MTRARFNPGGFKASVGKVLKAMSETISNDQTLQVKILQTVLPLATSSGDLHGESVAEV
jgi:hypothetical protein